MEFNLDRFQDANAALGDRAQSMNSRDIHFAVVLLQQISEIVPATRPAVSVGSGFSGFRAAARVALTGF